MNIIEDQLTNAANEMRHSVATIDTRPASTVRGRLQRRRTGVGVAIVAGVIGLSSVSAYIAQDDTGDDVAADGSKETSQTAEGNTSSAVAPAESAVQSSLLPRYGMTLDPWDVVEVTDTASLTLAFYSADSEGDAGPVLVGIELWTHEAGDAGDGGMLRPRFESSDAPMRSLGAVKLPIGRTAEAFEFLNPTISDTGDMGYWFTWSESPTVSAGVVVYASDFDKAREIILAMRELDDQEWTELVDGWSIESDVPVVTTTTIVASVLAEQQDRVGQYDMDSTAYTSITGGSVFLGGGTSHGETWAIVGRSLGSAECSGVRPIQNEDVCTTVEVLWPTVYPMGDAGILVLRPTQDAVSIVVTFDDGDAIEFPVVGVTEGYPAIAVIAVNHVGQAGTATSINADGDPIETVPWEVLGFYEPKG